MDNEVAAARAKLAARFGKVQLGGKGRLAIRTSAADWFALRWTSIF